MNAILSFIVCIAMLVSPTGVIPAQPETATTWTISDLTIAVGDESVTLALEARFAAAVGAEEAQLHFELGSGERTLMPMSGAINADGVRFTLGTGTKTYTIDNATFMELAGMEAEDVEVLDVAGDFFMSYAKVLNMVKDPAKYAEFYEASWGMMEDMLGAEFVETEAEVEGEMLPALQISGDLNAAGILNMMDAAAVCGIPELEEFVAVTLDLVNKASGMPVESFADLAALAGEEAGMEEAIMKLDCSYTTGDPLYSKMDMSMEVEGTEMVMQSESITRGEDTVALMVMEMNAEDMAMSYAITMDYTGPVTAPTRLQMVYNILAETDYSYDYTEDDGSEVSYTSKDSTAMRMTLDAEEVNGLETAAAEFIVDTISTYGYNDELDTYEDTVNVNMAYSEAMEEDGSITGSVVLDVNVMDETATISFDINRAEGEVVDRFANTTEQKLTADTEDAGYSALMADFMGVAADGMALAADDSVMQLIAMFETLTGVEDDTTYEEETAEEEAVEEAAEEEYAEVNEDGISVVSSLEDAASIFDGTIPSFTAPEGYTLQKVEVDEYSLYATYASADDEFEMCTYAYDSDAAYYSMTEDGALTAIDGMIVEMSMYGDEVGSASVYGNGREVTFYFGGVDMATAEAVVNGLI